MAAVAVNVVRRRQKCLKGKIYLKGRYSNMKKFLAIFMVVAVAEGDRLSGVMRMDALRLAA